ncbi:MAG: rhodanese-like domain-containing protein [Calditerrivibrio sp.]|nr:rhodanese-like domain-containing protein [Calditerrivibrio sp.]
MKKNLVACFVVLFCIQVNGGIFSNYNYVKPEELYNWLKSKKNLFLLDIQPKKEFDEEHIVGAVPTYAFPVKSDVDKKKLDSVIDRLKSTDIPVIIICPKGKAGAENAYNYIKSKGIDEKRLFILKGGMGDWKYDEFSEPK